MKLLDFISKTFFILGLFLVCLIGTAPDVPIHLLGLPLCGIGAVLAGIRAWRLDIRPSGGFLLPGVLMAALAYLVWRALQSPVRFLADMDLFLMAGLFCGFAMIWFTGRVRWLEPWLWILAVAGTVIGVLQVTVDMQFTLLRPLGFYRPVDVPHASGFFYNPNPFGTWCAMLLLLSASSLFLRRNGWGMRVSAGVALAAAAIGLLLTFCRAAFFGTALGFGMLVAAFLLVAVRWKSGGAKKWILIAGVLIMAGLVGYGASQWLPTLAERRTVSGEVSDLANIHTRYPYWRTGLSQFLDAPLTGMGSRSFGYESYRYWDPSLALNQKDPQYVHNEYIQILADYGFVGLLAVLAVILVAYGRAFHQAALPARRDQTREGRGKLAWCLGAIGAGTALLVDVFFSFSGHFAPMILLGGVLIGGVAAVHSGGRGEGDGKPSASGRWLVFSATLLAAGFLIFPGLLYGIATTRSFLAFARYENGKIEPLRYLEISEAQAVLLPRYPLFYHAGTFAMTIAADAPPESARVMHERALGHFDQALTAFPQSIDARLERAAVLQKLGRYQQADEDFKWAAEQGKSREFFYRAWMKWGEARYQRAVDAWQDGDADSATRWLTQALAAYEESKRLAWIRQDQFRYKQGRQQVEELIAFFKRTGEWRDLPPDH